MPGTPRRVAQILPPARCMMHLINAADWLNIRKLVGS
jgi:hypothetical protein